MSVPVLQASETVSSFASQTAWSVNKPSGVVAGDLLLIAIQLNISGGLTGPSGFTQVTTDFSQPGKLYVFSRIADGTEGSSFSFSWSSVRTGGVMCARITGAHGTTPIDASSTAALSNSGNPLTLPSITTTGADRLLLALLTCVRGTLVTYTATGSMVQAFEVDTIGGNRDIQFTGFDKSFTSAGATGSFDFTSSATTIARTGVLLAIAPAPDAQAITGAGDIATAEVFGSPTITTTATVSPSGIASAEAFGTPTVTPGGVTVSPSGIASAEAFGTPTVTGDGTIRPTGIPSEEAFGTPTVTPGAVTVSPSGIASVEAFGTPMVSSAVTIFPTGIASEEAFGTPTVTQPAEPTTARAMDWHITGLWDNPATAYAYYGRIADPIDGEVKIPLNDSRTASVKVSIYDPIVESIQAFTYERLLKVYYRGTLVFWGPVKLVDIDMNEGIATLSAVDPSLRLIRHFLRRGDLDGDLNASNHDRANVSIDANGMRLLRDAGNNTDQQNTRGVPDLGIADGTNDFPDAPDVLMGVARGDQVWSTVLDMSSNLGPDFELVPIDDTAGYYCQLNTFEHQGADNGVRFEYATGKDNLENLTWTEGSKYTTHVHVLDRQLRYRFTPANLDTSADTGPYVDWEVTDYDAHQHTEAEAHDVLLAFGNDILDAYSHPLVVASITLPIEEEADYHYVDDFTIGDTVSVSGRAGHVELAEKPYRITSITLKQEGPENATRTELEAVPSFFTSPDDEEG